MSDKKFLSISDFAKLSRTTRDTLLYYDKAGLLPPASRGENNYRSYSVRQLGTLNMIHVLQELGMTLSDIKRLTDGRTPESMDELLAQQIEKIDMKIDEWISARKLLLTLQKAIHSALNINENVITVQFMPAEAIVLGKLNDYSRGRNGYDALTDFYNDIKKRYPDLNLNYPVWGVFSEERIKQRDWIWPDRYFFYNPEGHDKKPAALYATGYARGEYGQSDELYKRLLEFIDHNGFEICGETYEEYPLNEIYVSDETHYLIRIMIPVREI